MAFIVTFLFGGSAMAANWVGPYTVVKVTSSAEPCGTSCSSYHRLRVTVKETPTTTCTLTNTTRTFVYYASDPNGWSDQWLNMLMSAQAQGLQVMLNSTETCSSIGMLIYGVEIATDPALLATP